MSFSFLFLFSILTIFSVFIVLDLIIPLPNFVHILPVYHTFNVYSDPFSLGPNDFNSVQRSFISYDHIFLYKIRFVFLVQLIDHAVHFFLAFKAAGFAFLRSDLFIFFIFSFSLFIFLFLKVHLLFSKYFFSPSLLLSLLTDLFNCIDFKAFYSCFFFIAIIAIVIVWDHASSVRI